jgi:hypothetical protein
VISIASSDEARQNGTALTGRVTWALRRALRLPSHAEDPLEGPLEETSSLRVRLAAAVLCAALLETAEAESHEAARELLLGSLSDPSLLLRCGPFSLHHDTWEDAYSDALRAHTEKLECLADALASDPSDDSTLALLDQHEHATRLLAWLDAPMWARQLQDTTPPLEATAHTLLKLVKQRVLNKEAAEILAKVFSLHAPYGAWSATSKPARNTSCPCGSGLRFKLCHGRLA